MQNYVANAEITLQASAARVWQALTDPVQVKQYMFGTNMTADWRVGGTILYRGEWEGKTYEDKGTIITLEPNAQLVTTYFSSMSGKKDVPENYNTITYTLHEDGDKTTLHITQDNNADQTAADTSSQNWQMILESIKKIVEA